MSHQGGGLRRIASVYSLVERIRSTELQAAAVAVQEARSARQSESGVSLEASAESRAALLTGDRLTWSAGEASRQGALHRMRRLAVIEGERDTVRAVAETAHIASRLEKEQLELALEHARKREALEQERRNQAAADDRFLARQIWGRHAEAQAATPEDAAEPQPSSQARILKPR